MASLASQNTGPSPATMAGVQASFMEVNLPFGDPKLMKHEDSQLSIALGIAAESMDLVLQNNVFLDPKNLPAQTLRVDAVLDDQSPPLQHVIWKDTPLNVTMVLLESEISFIGQTFAKMDKALSLGIFQVLVFTDDERPLYEGGSGLANKLPWKCEKVVKVHRMVASTSGDQLQPWLLTSTPQSRLGVGEPLFKITRLLAPGLEPKSVFINVPQPPQDLCAICLPISAVPKLLKEANVDVGSAVVLPGPLGRMLRWVLLRGISPEEFLRLEETFYEEDGCAFCNYPTFKGDLGSSYVIIQAFWRRAVRTEANLKKLWRVVDWQLKQTLDHFGSRPNLQWVGANKVRLGLESQQDLAAFMSNVLPRLKEMGLVMKNEATGEFLDDDGQASTTTSVTSGSVSSGGMVTENEAVVITDLPDYFLNHDVEDVVRVALKARGAVGADVIPLQVRKLDWAMGSPMNPTWQVAGRGVQILGGTVLNFSVASEKGMGMVHQWREYASARAAWRARRAQQPVGNQGSSLLRPGKQPQATEGAGPQVLVSRPVPKPQDLQMELDWQTVRGKRPRNERLE